EREARRTAALGRGVLACHLDRADVPALAIGVHLEGDRRARGERDGEILLRARRRVVAARLAGLVGAHDVVADLEIVLVGAVAATSRGGFHFRPQREWVVASPTSYSGPPSRSPGAVTPRRVG